MNLDACPDATTLDLASTSSSHTNKRTSLSERMSKLKDFSKHKVEQPGYQHLTNSNSENKYNIGILSKMIRLKDMRSSRPVISDNKDKKKGCLPGRSSDHSTCVYCTTSKNVYLVIEDKEQHKFHVNKELLMRKSAVFAAMFGGEYAEASRAEVMISDVNVTGFEFVIHYLHGCTNGCPIIDGKVKQHNLTTVPTCKNDTLEKDKPKTTLGDDPSEKVQQSCDNNSVQHTLEMSENSLDSLRIEDGQNSATNLDNMNDSTHSIPNQALLDLEARVDRYADILEVADRFLLDQLKDFLSAHLASVCLHPHTLAHLVHLACFYHLEHLAIDCMREAFMAAMPPAQVALIFQELANCGFTMQAYRALAGLLLQQCHLGDNKGQTPGVN